MTRRIGPAGRLFGLFGACSRRPYGDVLYGVSLVADLLAASDVLEEKA